MLDYTAPSTVEEAVRILAEAPGTAKVLSGGTDLLVQLRSGRTKPDLIVDIKKIPGISGIRERDGGFVIGASTPGSVIGECEALKQAWPGVVEAANLIGSTQVQGRASLAGNLCNASPAADSVPALIAAPVAFFVLLAGKMATKFVGIYPITKVFGSPQKEAMYTTLLMSTGLTFGTISALFGLSHGIIDQAQYSVVVAGVVASAVIPTLIANALFLPHHLLPQEEPEAAASPAVPTPALPPEQAG